MRVLAVSAVLFVLLAGCGKEAPVEVHHEIGADGRVDAKEPPSAVPVASAKPTPPPKLPSLESMVLTKITLADAFATAKPLMTDPPNEISVGTEALLAWAMKRMAWADVGVATNETSFAKVQKDIDAERGKRLCVRAAVVQISASKAIDGTTYLGLMGDRATGLFRFLAVKSSGDIVESTRAKFCGIVTGRHDYKNSGGGTSHAVEVVGMFDLPENHDH